MIEHVLVVIPANNEQAVIGACLDALLVARAHARDALGGRVEVRTVVVLDSCVDATEHQITADHDVEIIHARLARAGAARALGVAYARQGLDAARQGLDAARQGLNADPDRVWIASTDADSRVPPDWITTMVRYAERGADLALGTVRPDVAPTSSTYRQWRRRYVVSDGHPHVHGANLGLRADVYDRIGGWPLVACDEDVELVRRAEDHVGVRVVRTGAIPVVTSARLIGRAPHGFAGYLRRLPQESRHDNARLRAVLHGDLSRVESEG